nr:MAG TPA: hypothetical protein [Caudoviricetes sp.]
MTPCPTKTIRQCLRPTENSATNAWNLNLSNGNLNNWNTKASNKGRVRPVSALFTDLAIANLLSNKPK